MGSPLPPDPYKALGLDKTATLTAIRAAHRKLVLTCHPDKFPDPTVKAQKAEEFHQVQQAYELLSDDARRARYDESLKLAELRAEMFASRGPPSSTTPRSATYDYSPRTPASAGGNNHTSSARPNYDTRRGYSAEPESTFSRQYSYETKRSPRFQRVDPRDWQDHLEDPQPASARKASWHGYEERRYNTYDDRRSDRYDDFDDVDRQRRRQRDAEKAATRNGHADRKKTRDRTRRQDYDNKRSYTHPNLSPASDSESDREPAPPPRRASAAEPRRSKHDESRRHRRDVPHLRRAKTTTVEIEDVSEDDLENRPSRTYYRVNAAHDYISKSSSSKHDDREERSRPKLSKAHSSSARMAAPPPPPPPPPPPAPIPPSITVDQASRSSARRSSHTKTTKTRRVPEIVETADRRPHLTSMASSPASPKFSRASTMPNDKHGPAPAGLRRAQTSPLAHMVSSHDHAPSKSSRLRTSDLPDSRSSSPGSPEFSHAKKDAYSSGEELVEPRVLVFEPDSNGITRSFYLTKAMAASGKYTPRRGGRGPASASASRSTSARLSPRRESSSPPPSVRSIRIDPIKPMSSGNSRPSTGSGASVDKHFFGEVRWSPKYEADDIRFTEYPARSPGVSEYPTRSPGYDGPRSGGSTRESRDTYPYASSGRSGRMGSRTAGSYAQDAY